MFVHAAFVSQLSVPVVHSLRSVQVSPVPWNPSLQMQRKSPVVFWHVAFESQLLAPVAHSLRSSHDTPSPTKPGKQVQAKLPTVFAQTALSEQLSVPNVHSLRSVQPATGSPPKPGKHAHSNGTPSVAGSRSMQPAFSPQLSMPSEHSSTFAQVRPSPS